MADPCPVCGKDRVLVGYRHLCAIAPAVPPSLVQLARYEIEALQAEVKKLKADLADAHRQLNPLRSVGPTSPEASHVGPTSDVHVGPTECPTCKARRDAKAASQRRRREKKA